MDGRHLSQLLEDAAVRRPDQTAVEDEHGRRLSYAELVARRGSPGDAAGAGASTGATAWGSGCPRAWKP